MLLTFFLDFLQHALHFFVFILCLLKKFVQTVNIRPQNNRFLIFVKQFNPAVSGTFFALSKLLSKEAGT
ncbi:hypothetical protein EVA_20043 [gut metagenome]|uniref:Uncharacterized protein n=1 Tax=gut metagenome TaxID=749906 RepID=J9BW95_9ZZZZ